MTRYVLQHCSRCVWISSTTQLRRTANRQNPTDNIEMPAWACRLFRNWIDTLSAAHNTHTHNPFHSKCSKSLWELYIYMFFLLLLLLLLLLFIIIYSSCWYYHTHNCLGTYMVVILFASRAVSITEYTFIIHIHMSSA